MYFALLVVEIVILVLVLGESHPRALAALEKQA
jgi:hypothetical protein